MYAATLMIRGSENTLQTLWKTQAEALAAAGSYIMEEIILSWDISTAGYERDIAQKISDYCENCDWWAAIDEFNQYQDQRPKLSQGLNGRCNVVARTIDTTVPVVSLLAPLPTTTFTAATNQAYNSAPIPTSVSQHYNSVAQSQAPAPFKPSTLGATCRGPCQSHNEFAYADNPDGTHLCYQCKIQEQVFGSTVP